MKVAIYIRESGSRQYKPASPRAAYSPNTTFCLRYTEQGKRKWQQLDVKSYKEAQAASLKKLTELITDSCKQKPDVGTVISRNLDLPAPRPAKPVQSTGQLMLDAAIDKYIENVQTKSSKTSRGYRYTLQQFYASSANLVLANITTQQLYDFVGYLRREGLGDRTIHNRVVTARHKTGVNVSVPIPEDVAQELLAVLNGNADYIFWSGKGEAESATKNWAKYYIAPLFAAAKIECAGHMMSHRLRDTFAVDLLQKGVPFEDVSKALGHMSIKTTERSYAKWVKGRQDRLDSLVMGYAAPAQMPPLPEVAGTTRYGEKNVYYAKGSAWNGYRLSVGDSNGPFMEYAGTRTALGSAGLMVESQADGALHVVWNGKSKAWLQMGGDSPSDISLLSLTVRVNRAPDSEVRLGVSSASVPVTAELKALPGGTYATLALPLSCFSAQDLRKTPTIAHLETSGHLDLSVSEIRLTETRMGAVCPTE
jgi:hypothetical protein